MECFFDIKFLKSWDIFGIAVVFNIEEKIYFSVSPGHYKTFVIGVILSDTKPHIDVNISTFASEIRTEKYCLLL